MGGRSLSHSGECLRSRIPKSALTWLFLASSFSESDNASNPDINGIWISERGGGGERKAGRNVPIDGRLMDDRKGSSESVVLSSGYEKLTKAFPFPLSKRAREPPAQPP